jgi:Ser/Thr protein kinase RdoA (MazF antagonist)
MVRHAVRLLSWVPGDVMNHAVITHNLLVNTGKFVGRLENALAGFDHDGLHRVHMWDLACTPEVERFVPMIQDEEVCYWLTFMRIPGKDSWMLSMDIEMLNPRSPV